MVSSLLSQVQSALGHGDFLAAYDLARSLPARGQLRGDEARIVYVRVLALARAGSTQQAEAELDGFTFDQLDLPADLGEDLAAFRARLAKDRAVDLTGLEHEAAAREAAGAYEAVFTRYGRYYACINAATLWLLAGDRERARTLADRAAILARDADRTQPSDAYWATVTLAESALILGADDAAARHLATAGKTCPDDLAARASTRRQLDLICRMRGLEPREVLAPLANPDVLHYCGHMISADAASGPFAASDESRVRSELDRWLSQRSVGDAYGSLASGADILAVEALLRHGAEVHVRLPFDREEFVQTSVRPAGSDWVARFERCAELATSVEVTCDSSYLGDDALFGFASRVAMGQAVIRARSLTSDVLQLAVWDGVQGPSVAGTSHDVAVWRSAGLPTHVIEVRGPARKRTPDRSRPSTDERRPIRAVLFGDLQGFSALHDEELFRFIDGPLQSIAAVIKSHGEAIVRRATWGDALFIAATDAVTIARCALSVQEALAATDMAAHGLPETLAMRIAVHVGPVVWAYDPILDETDVFGRELTRAARIEPRTPPGEVYATSALAALLALVPDSGVVPHYVGRVPTAKGFETIPMYVLRRRPVLRQG